MQYCSDSVLVAPSLSIEGTPSLSGMKVSFTQGFISGEDVLTYAGPLSASMSTPGTLVLTGGSSVQDYVDALKLVRYKNLKTTPTLGTRKITISLNDVDYLPATGHFYRFVPHAPGINWSAAKREAEETVYYGLRGYLATITSQVENDFIQSKTKGVGWIGASDAAVEGDWCWVTGPEGLINGGTLFWRGTGSQARSNPMLYGPVNGAYSNWDGSTPEPNNLNGENYAQILFPAQKWNDLADNSNGNAGYLIEFGGYSDDPVLDLSATVELVVNTIYFKTDAITPICEGDSVQLNRPDPTASYSWNLAGSLSNSRIANPYAKPNITTSYFVQATRGVCNGSATFNVPVNLKPISLLKAEENICKGASISLDPGLTASYAWSNGATSRTITVNSSGTYSVQLKSEFGCKNISSSKVTIYDYPTIDLSKLTTLSCGSAKSNLLAISTNAPTFTLSSTSTKMTFNGLTASSSDFGVYPVVYKANHAYCPSTTSFDLSFYKTPAVNLTIDDQTCSGYNLNVSYVGDATVNQANFKWEFGGAVVANAIGLNALIVPLGINKSQRDLSLTVTQDGCSNSFVQKDIKVIPNLDLTVTDSLGCEPFNTQFLAKNTEIVTYNWDFGDGSPVQTLGNNPFHNYPVAGYYDVKLKVTTVVASGTGCTNEIKVNRMVHVAPIPDVAFSLSPDLCLNPGLNSLSYAGVIGNSSDKYQWDLSGLSPIEIVKDPLLTQGPLDFDLKVHPTVSVGLKVLSKFGCQSLSKSIVLKRKPDFTIVSDQVVGCIPFSPNFNGQISDPHDRVDFTWDFGNSLTSTGPNVFSTYLVPDMKYSLSVIGKSSVTGCSNTFSGINFLRTYPKPKAAFTMDHPVVYNDKPDVKFTDTSIGASGWLWDFADGSTSSIQDPTYHFVKMGHQKIILEAVNTDLCTDTISHDVLIAFDRIFPPTGFSPNAKNPVDRIFALNSEGIMPSGYHLTIQSRWDDLVFESRDEIKGWDGRIKNGSFAPSGAYVWVLFFTDFLGHRHQQTGTVVLIY